MSTSPLKINMARMSSLSKDAMHRLRCTTMEDSENRESECVQVPGCVLLN